MTAALRQNPSMVVTTPQGNDWSVSSPLHNRLATEDRAVHAWYRFVLSFPPHLVRKYFGLFGLTENSVVLDPFCGTGTTLVEAKKLGIASVGFEANPMAVLASRTKVNWSVDANLLRSEAHRIASEAEADLRPVRAAEFLGDGIFERETLFGLLSLDPECERLLLAGSISPVPLHK